MHLGRVDLFEFCRQPPGHAAHQLEDVLLNGLNGKEAVEDAGRQHPRVQDVLELSVDLVQPVKKGVSILDFDVPGLDVDVIALEVGFFHQLGLSKPEIKGL